LPDIDPRTSVEDAFGWLELALPFTESGWPLEKIKMKGRPDQESFRTLKVGRRSDE
jgi:hypothetical protein